MATIGCLIDGVDNYSANFIFAQMLLFNNSWAGLGIFTHTPKVVEEVYEVGFYEGAASGSAICNLQIYDVTNGVSDCVQIGGNFDCSCQNSVGWRSYSLTDSEIFKLTAGQTYGIGVRVTTIAAVNFGAHNTASLPQQFTTATHDTLTGSNDWPSNWAGVIDINYVMPIYAKTRIHTATRIEIEKYG